MKKGIILFLSVLLCFTIAACAEQKTKPPVSEQSSGQEQSDTQNSIEVSENQSANSQELESSNSTETSGTPETGARKIKLAIDGQEFDVTLYIPLPLMRFMICYPLNSPLRISTA